MGVTAEPAVRTPGVYVISELTDCSYDIFFLPVL